MAPEIPGLEGVDPQLLQEDLTTAAITFAVRQALGGTLTRADLRRIKIFPIDVTFDLSQAKNYSDFTDKPDFEIPAAEQLALGFKVLNPGAFANVSLVFEDTRGPVIDVGESSLEIIRFGRFWVLNPNAQAGKTLKLRIYQDPYILGVLPPRLTAELVKVVDVNNAAIDFATETTLAAISTFLGTQIDLKSTQLRDALRGGSNRTITDVYDILNTLYGTLSIAGLRDALRGLSSKTLTDLDSRLATVIGQLGNRSAAPAMQYVTVTTAGTPVQGPSITIPDGFRLVVAYHPSNTGVIGVGGSSANANLSTGTPFRLTAAGQALEYKLTNANLLWFDTTVSGDKVMLTVEQ